MLTLGIDFGTTNCSAAVYRAGRVQLIPLEDGDTILPSTICITREGEVLVGRQAIVRFLELTRHT
ncbi:MAG: Hsp70 family protein, partial [Anaerolineae bacterium]